MRLQGRVAIVTGGAAPSGRRSPPAGPRGSGRRRGRPRADAAEAVAAGLEGAPARARRHRPAAWAALVAARRRRARARRHPGQRRGHPRAGARRGHERRGLGPRPPHQRLLRFFGCRAVDPADAARGAGPIVNVVTGQFGVAYSSAYTSSKFLVHGFSQCLVLEVARYGIRVNCIAPGSIPDTGFERWYREKAELLGMRLRRLPRRARSTRSRCTASAARGHRRGRAVPRLRRRRLCDRAAAQRRRRLQRLRLRAAPARRCDGEPAYFDPDRPADPQRRAAGQLGRSTLLEAYDAIDRGDVDRAPSGCSSRSASSSRSSRTSTSTGSGRC